MPAGTFVTHFGKQIHYDGAKEGDTVLLIVGDARHRLKPPPSGAGRKIAEIGDQLRQNGDLGIGAVVAQEVADLIALLHVSDKSCSRADSRDDAGQFHMPVRDVNNDRAVGREPCEIARGDAERQRGRNHREKSEVHHGRPPRRQRAPQHMGVYVADEKKGLERHHRDRPDRGRPAEPWQHHLGKHRLNGEQQQRRYEQGCREQHRRRPQRGWDRPRQRGHHVERSHGGQSPDARRS